MTTLSTEAQLDLLRQQYNTLLVYLRMLAEGLNSEEKRYWNQFDKFNQACNDSENGGSEYNQAVAVLSGNICQYLRMMANFAENASNDGSLGPRPGLPSLSQVAAHEKRNIVGFWICKVRVDDFPGVWGRHLALTVRDGKVVIRTDAEACEPIDDPERVLTSLPVDITGCPVPWPEDLKVQQLPA